MNDDDSRCCGTGTCLINAQGVCWCGQQWDGEKMCLPAPQPASTVQPPAANAPNSDAVNSRQPAK